MGKKKQRIMTEEERIILTKGLSGAPAGWQTDEVVGLSTDDRDIAQTYADMMNKRREMHPDARTPVTLGEAFGLASAYLRRSGKRAEFAHTGLSLTRTVEENETVGTDASPVCLRLTDTDKSTQAPAEGDRLLVISTDTDAEAWLNFRETPAVVRAVKWEETVPESGILPLTLPLFEGICFDLRKIPGDATRPPLSRLFGACAGAKLLLISGAAQSDLSELASAWKISASAIAVLTADGETRFAYSESDILPVNTAWLRSLPPRRQLRIRIATDPAGAAEPIVRCPVAGGCSPYLAESNALPERILHGDLTVAGAVRRLGGDCFRSSLETVLAPLLSVACAGVDYTEVRLAVALRFPEPDSETALGDLMATILGMYRAQTEFACPAALYARTDDTLPAPELTVYAVGRAEGTVPPVFSAPGGGVFCVAPVMQDTGIPDFSLLRRLLGDVHALRLAGKLTGARVAVGETLGDCIRRVSGHGLTCRLADAETGNAALRLALILDGSGLPFARVGTVETELPVRDPETGESLPPRCGKYIWSGKYEITLLSRPGDAGALSLASTLRRTGSDCVCLTPADGSGPLSRRILTSRVLILCPGAVLPEDSYTDFALRMLRSDGGVILRFSEETAVPAGFPTRTFPQGLPQSVLKELASICR